MRWGALLPRSQPSSSANANRVSHSSRQKGDSGRYANNKAKVELNQDACWDLRFRENQIVNKEMESGGTAAGTAQGLQLGLQSVVYMPEAIHYQMQHFVHQAPTASYHVSANVSAGVPVFAVRLVLRLAISCCYCSTAAFSHSVFFSLVSSLVSPLAEGAAQEGGNARNGRRSSSKPSGFRLYQLPDLAFKFQLEFHFECLLISSYLHFPDAQLGLQSLDLRRILGRDLRGSDSHRLPLTRSLAAPLNLWALLWIPGCVSCCAVLLTVRAEIDGRARFRDHRAPSRTYSGGCFLWPLPLYLAICICRVERVDPLYRQTIF
jgi:hypothetical protein